MKNILRIFTSDVKSLFKNRVALLLVCGLSILPSLYAWFNIYASWDPYGNTNGIKIAVCNKDLGGKILDSDVDIGEELIENLKENDSLGWVFIDDEEKAIELARKGDVYASIIIPKDFSEKMTTILNDNPMKPSLEYYVNQKVNAISPKITDKGASTLQTEIGSTFIESVTEEIFSALEEVDITTEDYTETFDSYKKYLDYLIENIPTVIERLNTTAGTAESGSELIALSAEDIDLVTNVLNDSISFTDDLKTDMDSLNSGADEFSSELVETITLTKVCVEDLDNNTVELKKRIILDKPDVVDTLNDTSDDLNRLIDKIQAIQRSLDDFDEGISNEISALDTILEGQLGELQDLVDAISSFDVKDTGAYKLTKAINTLTSQIKANLERLDKALENAYQSSNTKYTNVNTIDTKLTDLFEELEGKTEITETAVGISDDIFITIEKLQKEIGSAESLLCDNLDSIKEFLKNTNANNNFLQSLVNLKLKQSELEVFGKEYYVLSTLLENVMGEVDSATPTIASIDDTTDVVDNDIDDYVDSIEYYISNMQKDIKDTRKYINTIYELLADEKNYLVTRVDDITDISLVRLDNIAEQLSDLADDINDKDSAERSLENIHNLNVNIISNLESLIMKINTDLTTSVKRYLSSVSDFSSDINMLLVSINGKTKLMKDFLNNTANSGQVAADDMLKLAENLPKLEEDLTKVSNRLDDFNDKLDIERFSDLILSNKSIVSDFMAYPVDLNTHDLYYTEYYGVSMTPFYTTLCLWVGVLVLAGVLTTKSKNVDFKPTPLQVYLGKYPLFVILSIIQGLIVSLGDLFLLGVTAVEPGLFVILTMFQSLVFCTILYTLICLMGNIGKALGVVFLVLQVAGSGGTFPIEMLPLFFQRLYQWLPFTYGIRALREAVFGVFYPGLVEDVSALMCYFAVSLAVGILFVSKTHKHIESITHKFEESGLSE